mmetsp:Transcript_11763/g.23432  ORF Transcript_11763/g.23432 Transcript_11763/m.23432 type:complete len:536 (+) Transcript_11763:310-1917(+)
MMLSPPQSSSFRVSPTLPRETPTSSRPNSRRASFAFTPNSAFGRTNSLVSTPSSDVNLDKSRKYCNSSSLPFENSSLLSTAENSCPPFQENRKRRLDDLLVDRESVSFAPSVKPNEDILTSRSYQRNHEKRHKSFKCISPSDATSSHSFTLTTPGARNVPLTKLPSTKLSRRTRKIENVITPPPQSVQPVISFSLSRRRNTNVNRNTNILSMFKPISASLENKNTRKESFPRMTRKNLSYYSDHFSNPECPPREAASSCPHGQYNTKRHDSSASLPLSTSSRGGYRCPSPSSHQFSPATPANYHYKRAYKSPRIESKNFILNSPIVVSSNNIGSPPSIRPRKRIECPSIDCNLLPQMSAKSACGSRTVESRGFLLQIPSVSRSSEQRLSRHALCKKEKRPGSDCYDVDPTEIFVYPPPCAENLSGFAAQNRNHVGNCSTDSLDGLGQRYSSTNSQSSSINEQNDNTGSGNCSTDSLGGLSVLPRHDVSCKERPFPARDLIASSTNQLPGGGRLLSPPLFLSNPAYRVDAGISMLP